MGTRFRTLLAPIGVSTGDGRRFADGAINLADVPFPFEWARSREGGHDGAVVIGAVQQAAVMTVEKAIADEWISADQVAGLDAKSKAVFAQGELFDGVDREEMPRLAEDVAEAMHLIGAGTLGPSVDLDTFTAIPVMAGSDEELTWEAVEAYMEENDGAEPEVELLITAGRVRAATLVSIPAFHETSAPLELIEQDADALALAASENPDTIGEHERAMVRLARAMTAAAGPGAPGNPAPPVDRFALPSLDGPTPVTWDWETGRVFGHIATWRTCHVGYADVCVTPPHAEGGSYSWFNRYAVETADGGTIWAGRLTIGGRHAGLALSASSAMAAYDDKTVAADVVAYEDAHGIVVSGSIRSGVTGAERAVLDRRKVSGDWREVGGSLALVEVLALSPGPRAHSEPGFPVAETHSRHGRQVALTASFGPEDVPAQVLSPLVDVKALAAAVVDEQEERKARLTAVADARKALTAMFDGEARKALAAVLGEE